MCPSSLLRRSPSGLRAAAVRWWGGGVEVGRDPGSAEPDEGGRGGERYGGSGPPVLSDSPITLCVLMGRPTASEAVREALQYTGA
ncbi:hypothetical protein EDD91_7321 [Streptomyces sp. KS 21]|nr:hypothetical protein EDD91_7321 [Streptomyces sp. KS 21]